MRFCNFSLSHTDGARQLRFAKSTTLIASYISQIVLLCSCVVRWQFRTTTAKTVLSTGLLEKVLQHFLWAFRQNSTIFTDEWYLVTAYININSAGILVNHLSHTLAFGDMYVWFLVKEYMTSVKNCNCWMWIRSNSYHQWRGLFVKNGFESSMHLKGRACILNNYCQRFSIGKNFHRTTDLEKDLWNPWDPKQNGKCSKILCQLFTISFSKNFD